MIFQMLGERCSAALNRGLPSRDWARTLAVGAIAFLTLPDSSAQKAVDFRKHVEFLANDSLEGRMTGSDGERIAAAYVANSLRGIGAESVVPISDGVNAHPMSSAFDFSMGRELGDNNSAVIPGLINTGYFLPMEYSSSGECAGEPVWFADALSVADRVVLVEWFEADPHTDQETPRQLASRLADEGAVGVIFLCDSNRTAYQPNYSRNTTPLAIPVLIDPCTASLEIWNPLPEEVELHVDLEDVTGTGYNVAGLVNHGAEHTVILGAHYDHLGWGKHGSLYRGEPAIHNGADDNASGVAMIIELAKQLSKRKYKNFNYLVVAFSGEELGLYGSNHFVEHLPVEASKVSYMLNFDMIGRYEESRGLAINGVGTSPMWMQIIDKTKTDMKVVTSESGIGPSDHTPFYLKGIPVLHFFTGAHDDYHKPTDDVDKVNYDGMVDIMDYVLELIDATQTSDTLPFTKTKEESNRNAPRFSVTLGVVPDYLFDGVGMRISGVTEGKPASKAGIESGDIVIQLGEHTVADMMTYMEGLSRFKKGDRVTVMIRRGDEELPFEVTF